MRCLGLVLVVAIGCGPAIALDDGASGSGSDDTQAGDSGSSTSTTSTTTGHDSTSTGPDTGSTSTGHAETGDSGDWPAGFLDDTDGQSECSIWDQDCPLGEKCVQWSRSGAPPWNGMRCVPLPPDPRQPGEACTVEGRGASTLDTCDVGSLCWYVDPETDEGTCFAYCGGSENNPVCADPSTTCVQSGGGDLSYCLPLCDPLAQDCANGGACRNYGANFVCFPECSGCPDDGFGDPCWEYECAAGLTCADAVAVPGCEAEGCCTPYCDLDEAVECPGEGQSCVPFFEPGQAPPQQQDVGICAVAA